MNLTLCGVSSPPSPGLLYLQKLFVKWFPDDKSLVPPAPMRGWLNACTCIRNHGNYFHAWFPAAWEAGYERAALP